MFRQIFKYYKTYIHRFFFAILSCNKISYISIHSIKISDVEQEKLVAGVTGLEPAASGVTGRRSNQLSYTPKVQFKDYPILTRTYYQQKFVILLIWLLNKFNK